MCKEGESYGPQDMLTYEVLAGHTTLFTQAKGPTHTSLRSMPRKSYLLVAGKNSKRREVTEGTEGETIGMLCGPQHLDFLFVTTSGLIGDTHERERHRLFS